MRCFALLAALLAAFCCETARADVIYDVFFRVPGQGDGLGTTFNVLPDQTITGVEAVLRETISGLSTSALAVSNVNGFRIDITVVGSNGATSGKVTNTAGGSTTDSDSATTFGYFSIAGGRGPSPDVGGVREFILGTLNFTAPTTGATTFSLVDPNPGLPGDITTLAGPGANGLEPLGTFRTHGVTLQVVPEPNVLLALTFTSALACIRRRRSQA